MQYLFPKCDFPETFVILSGLCSFYIVLHARQDLVTLLGIQLNEKNIVNCRKWN